MVSLLGMADVLISKPGGGTIMEAMALGLPLAIDHAVPCVPWKRANLDFAVAHGATAIAHIGHIPATVDAVLAQPRRFAAAAQFSKFSREFPHFGDFLGHTAIAWRLRPYAFLKNSDVPHDKAYLRARYTFDERQTIGTGCFGSVYLAQDHWKNRPVAIKKQLQLPWSAAEHNVQMQLRHPNILRAHDEAWGKHHQYLVTELGAPIDPRTVTLAQAQTYLRQLLDGLAYTHDMGVAHRDVKLGNVLVCNNTLRVIDYGKAGFHLSRSMQRLCVQADLARACEVFAGLMKHCAPRAADDFKAWYKGQPRLSVAGIREHPLVRTTAGGATAAPHRLARACWPLRKALHTTAIMFPVNFRPTFVLPYTVHASRSRIPCPLPLDSLLDAAPPTMLDSAWITTRFKQARASAHQVDKTSYLCVFNRDIAPLLTCELAALERLAMQNCRLNMCGDERFRFAIQTDPWGLPTQAYAPEYLFHRSICTQHGCRALALIPTPDHAQSNSILCLAGIACTPDGMRLRREGRGFQTLADRPIGKTAYAQARHALQQVLQTLLLRDADVTIVGHSLGRHRGHAHARRATRGNAGAFEIGHFRGTESSQERRG